MTLRPVSPMLATSATVLPRGAEWTYEVKWDGYRTIALKDGARVKLSSRNLKDATSQYPAIARAIAQLHADTALLDGELVAVDERGLPSFQALHHQSAATVVFYAFDLLHVDGRDLLKVPLDERRAALPPVVHGPRFCVRSHCLERLNRSRPRFDAFSWRASSPSGGFRITNLEGEATPGLKSSSIAGRNS